MGAGPKPCSVQDREHSSGVKKGGGDNSRQTSFLLISSNSSLLAASEYKKQFDTPPAYCGEIY